MSTQETYTNTINKINESGVFYTILALCISLIIFILVFMFNKKYITSFLTFSIINGEKSLEAELRDSFLVLISVFCIVVSLFAVIPNLEEIKKLFFDNNLRTVSFVILYTISLVVLLTMLPTNILDKYSYIVIPISMLLGAILFFISYADGYFKSGFTENIRATVLFTCLIAISFVLYIVNPGGLIEGYFNSTSLAKLFVSATGLFGFLYTMVNLTIFNPSTSETTNTSRLIYPGLFAIVIFLSAFVYGVTSTDFTKDKTAIAGTVVLSLVAMFLWSILFSTGLSSINKSNMDVSSYKKTVLTLFTICVGLVIGSWFVQNIDNKSTVFNVAEWGFSIVVVVALLIIVYKILSKVYEKVIPYEIQKKTEEELKNKTASFFGSVTKEFNETSISSLVALITVIAAISVYSIGPVLYNKYSIRGGVVLLSAPSNLNEQNTLATYEELNGPVPETAPTEYDGGASRTFNYNYGLSFWVYLDSSSPNTNPSYSKYTSILNYGGKPNILYKASTNTLVITFDDKPISKDQDIDNINETNDFGRRIVYKKERFALQKWNHFVINYSGRYLDVFLNGELVKSNIKVVPHMNLDSLVSGTENGIYGGLCNIVYYNKPLTITKIYYIYNTLKDKNPPVL
jgi:hypothetical protein